MTAERIKLAETLGKLGDEEIAVLAYQADGMLHGQTKYGRLDLRNDARDIGGRETLEEARDMLNYAAMAFVRAQLRGQRERPFDQRAADVAQFRAAFKAPTSKKPTVLSDDRTKLHLRLISEEFCELMEAVFGTSLARLRHEIGSRINDMSPDVDIVGVADALADLDYVIEGMRQEMGIPGDAVHAEVHRSNMSKVGGQIDANGKIQKGDNYRPPDIAGVLVASGMR